MYFVQIYKGANIYIYIYNYIQLLNNTLAMN